MQWSYMSNWVFFLELLKAGYPISIFLFVVGNAQIQEKFVVDGVLGAIDVYTI